MGLKKQLDRLLQAAVDRGDIPGVAAIAIEQDATMYEGAFGKRVMGQEPPMTLDTVAWIASMTKAVTGAAAMQLVEQGRLALDEPASRWAPSLADAKVLDGFDEAGAPILRPPKREITLRHLLTHTAGFSYDFWSGDIIRCMEAAGTPPIISCQDQALTTPLRFDPGEGWDYGINIDWVGKLVEAVSGKRLGQYMEENLFAPLGMGDTAFRIRDDMRWRLAKIHQRGELGSLEPQPELEIPQEPQFEMGGGGLYSTAIDYLKFVRMILEEGRGNGNQVLKPETVAMMSRNQMGDLRVRPLHTAMPSLSNDAEFFPGLPKTWGLSFMINEEEAPTGRPAGSLAWAGLANSYYWIDPKNGIGGVFITQILPFADVKALPLYLAFEKAVYDFR
ncbi:MAG TPA: serine hydrolase domain-containing protein [Burkholderiaceae bacterium]|nr:serine hydrolase domain-containing protein [Burkholderiaceae bacterium]